MINEQERQDRTRLIYIQAAKQGPEADRGEKKKVEGEKRRGKADRKVLDSLG